MFYEIGWNNLVNILKQFIKWLEFTFITKGKVTVSVLHYGEILLVCMSTCMFFERELFKQCL